MTTVSRAADYVTSLVNTGRYNQALAMTIAEREFGVSTKMIGAERTRRRVAAKASREKKKAYQSTAPVWAKERD